MKKLLLLGVNLSSGNRGVAALGLGAANVLYDNFGPDCEITILFTRGQAYYKKSSYAVQTNDKQIDVVGYEINGKHLVSLIADAWKYKILGIKPSSELSQLVVDQDMFFNVNAGDRW